MLRVKVDSSSIEKSLKIFKRKFKESGVVNELRERQQFTNDEDLIFSIRITCTFSSMLTKRY